MLDKSFNLCYNIIVPRGTQNKFSRKAERGNFYGKQENDTGTDTRGSKE